MTPSERDRKIAINRFVSILSGAQRAFHLYRQSTKTLDEILDNVVTRFTSASGGEVLKFGLTNQSVVFGGEATGEPLLARTFAASFRILGFREIIFKPPPIQSRHFFQLLNIVSNNDPIEIKKEKLAPFADNDEEKPITLVPISSNALTLRLSDETLQKRLHVLTLPASQGGLGFIDEINRAHLTNLADVYTWIAMWAEKLEKSLRAFVRVIVDTSREGYFPSERFLKVFPLPPSLTDALIKKIANTPPPRARRKTNLGLEFRPAERRLPGVVVDWQTYLASFSSDDIRLRHDLLTSGSQQNELADLDLASSLIQDTAVNKRLGLRILIRILSHQNATVVQEKALKLGIAVWIQQNPAEADMSILTLVSSLRKALATSHNIALTLFPIRNSPVESEMYLKMERYLMSLGDVVFPPLILALEAEADRGMRRKLCLVLTSLAREQGTDKLRQAFETASPYLLRNIVMILGDVRSQEAHEHLTELLAHPQRIVRVEVLHSLGKIGTPEATQSLLHALQRPLALDEKKIALDQLTARHDRVVLEPLIKLTRLESQPSAWRTALITAIGTLGGPGVRSFLESLKKPTSLFSGFHSEQKEEQALISQLLNRMSS